MRKRISRRISLLVVVAMLLTLWPSLQSQAQNALLPLTSPATPGSATATAGLPTPIGTPGNNFTPTATPDAPSSPPPATPIITVTPQPNPHLPGLVPHISFNPNPIAVGDSAVLTITIDNQAPDPATSLTVNLPVPAGVVITGQAHQQNPGRTVAVASGTPAVTPSSSSTPVVSATPLVTASPSPSPTPTGPLTWTVPSLAGNSSVTFTASFQLVSAPVGGALLVAPQISAQGLAAPVTETRGVLVVNPQLPPATAQFTPGTAAVLHSTDGAVTVNFPANAYTSALTLQHAVQPPDGYTPPPSILGFHRGLGTFYLSATDGQSRQVHQFDQPLTITVGYTPQQLQALGTSAGDLTLFWYDDAQHNWVPLSTYVDPNTGTASAQVSHFSAYSLGDGSSPSSGFIPSLMDGQTDLFTGSSNYSYPISLPAGPGGLRPHLQLSYNSAATDGKLGQRDTAQPGWVGKGWSLNTGYIALNAVAANEQHPQYVYYTLVQDGQSYDLVGTCSGTCRVSEPDGWNWRTNKENFSKIVVSRNGLSDSSRGGFSWNVPLWRYKWDIWSKDGTLYEYSEDSWWGWDNCGFDNTSYMETYKWQLSRVQDTFGNVINYGYHRAGEAVTADCAYVHGRDDWDVWPYTITWGSNINVAGSYDRYEVLFTPITRTIGFYNFESSTNQLGQGPHETEQLSYFQVLSNPSNPWNSSAYTYTTMYNLNYADLYSSMLSDTWACSMGIGPDCTYSATGNAQPTLLSIQRSGWGANGWRALPATSFSYGPSPPPSSNHYPSGQFNRLIQVNNGQGGTISFTYEDIGQVTGNGNPQFVNNRRVISKTLGDGRGNNYTWHYSYQHPAYNWLGTEPLALDTYPNSAALWYVNSQNQNPYLAHPAMTIFRGHSQVTETDPNGTVTVHQFHQGDIGCTPGGGCNFNNLINMEFRVGKEYHRVTSGSNGNNLSEMLNATQVQFNGSIGTPYTGVWNAFSFENIQQDTSWGWPTAGGALTSKTKTTNYYYDPSFQQGGTQYGNLTRMEERDSSSNVVRRSDYYYATNTSSAYIVNRKYQEATFDGSSNYAALTFYTYDNSNQVGYVGTTGQLSLVRKLYDVPAVQNFANGTTMHGQDARYYYDSFGNKTRTDTFDGSGNATWNNSWSLTTAGNGSYARTTTTQYDPLFNVFSIQTTHPAAVTGGQGMIEYAGYDYHMGTMTQTVDFNGNATSAEYDEFGRLTKVIKPGDSSALPTQKYDYYDTGLPMQYIVENREAAGNGDYLPVQHFYNGMGQEIQTKSESQWYNGHQNIVVDKVYDGLGNVISESEPHYVSGDDSTFWQYQGGTSTLWTTTTYDGLNRQLNVQLPDNTIPPTQMRYYIGTIGPTTVMTDARGNVRQNESDVLGRQVAVREYTGTNGVILYATTSYTYNPLDKPTQVTVSSPFANTSPTTSYSYDSLGRKVAMTDPDMGGPSLSWTYVYSPTGPLIQQTDTRGQATYFSYDHLDRMTQKAYNNSDPATNYYYDQGTGNLGYRTSMVRSVSPYANITNWTYDNRGRVQEADYYANNHGPYGYRYSYDSDNRVTQLVLPSAGPETLYYGYDGARRPTSLCYSISGGGSGCYINSANTSYTALGQPQTLAYGNNVVETWSYRGNMPERLNQLTVGTNGSLFNRYYSYDNAGNITVVGAQGSDPMANQNQNFSYDPLNRLYLAWTDSGGPAQYNETYNYDPFGNMTNKAGAAYQYGNGGSGCAGPHQLCSTGSQTFSYDANGNQYPAGANTQFNADNELISYSSSGWQYSYSYGADGERATLTRTSLQASTTIYLGPLFEMDVDASNVQITRRTLYQFNGTIVAQRDSASKSLIYLHPDHQGSIALVTDGNGVATHQEFKPWGELRYGGIGQTSLGYTGQRLDSGTGLLYDHARYYNATISHFNSADTVIPGPGSQDVNRYSYVTNNPVNLTDPTGHRSSDPTDCGRHEDCNSSTPTNPLDHWPYIAYCGDGGPACGIDYASELQWLANQFGGYSPNSLPGQFVSLPCDVHGGIYVGIYWWTPFHGAGSWAATVRCTIPVWGSFEFPFVINSGSLTVAFSSDATNPVTQRVSGSCIRGLLDCFTNPALNRPLLVDVQPGQTWTGTINWTLCVMTSTGTPCGAGQTTSTFYIPYLCFLPSGKPPRI